MMTDLRAGGILSLVAVGMIVGSPLAGYLSTRLLGSILESHGRIGPAFTVADYREDFFVLFSPQPARTSREYRNNQTLISFHSKLHSTDLADGGSLKLPAN